MKCLSRSKVILLTIRLCLADILFMCGYIAIGVYFLYNGLTELHNLAYIGGLWLLGSLIFICNIVRSVKRVCSDYKFSLIKFDVVKENGRFYNKNDYDTEYYLKNIVGDLVDKSKSGGETSECSED